ncbi:hypothetical protein Q5424_09010 [Conexibacter sp. JD483]|uniref:hypothetical protein n=1 Tax=unclassified Conexibacter TaxID=2627773 RepID=UPI00271ABA9E|nr:MULTISPECIES: hypothetical protein [unclassified Conexibacter]MDO8184506.1 hypothetical protein [Conexibacter sp. CPCC 205706]MDO8197812.1 hypothetical protein [Conexibacter sp. CPCC 205762]MDR9369218.1 hypothetical protein [Conexibacter sp. JD483]
MATKDIRTTQAHVSCDVCGRTLLRGERAETYLSGGTRREVCELCQPRALHEGWVREGAALERGTRPASGERRRSLFGRLKRPRPEESGGGNGHGYDESHEPSPSRSTRVSRVERMEPERELRQVRAVPTNVEQRTATAIDRFNQSEHTRTISGVARSLGAPVVVARAHEEPASIVTIVVSWELCWYRYEVDLDAGNVRTAGQGYELDELDPADRVEANAVADEYGSLTPA